MADEWTITHGSKPACVSQADPDERLGGDPASDCVAIVTRGGPPIPAFDPSKLIAGQRQEDGSWRYSIPVAKQAPYFPAGQEIRPVSADELWHRLDELEHLFRCFATSGEASDRIRADLADKARETVAVLERGDRYPTDPNGDMPEREE